MELVFPIYFFASTATEYKLICNDSLEVSVSKGAKKYCIIQANSVADLKTIRFEIHDNNIVKLFTGKCEIISDDADFSAMNSQKNKDKLNQFGSQIEFTVQNCLSVIDRKLCVFCEVHCETEYISSGRETRVFFEAKIAHKSNKQIKHYFYFDYSDKNSQFVCWSDYGYLHFEKNRML